MKVVETALAGVVIVEPSVFRDERGFFTETFNAQCFAAAGLPTRFRQANHSRSTQNVLRGLHYQLRRPQGKLVSCVRGEIFDVAVDIRRGSPSFGKWAGVVLRDDEPRALWIPPGFAHGFCVLSELADVVYQCTELYAPDDDHGVLWSDPALAIKWPVHAPVLSPKDERFPGLSMSRDDLPTFSAGAPRQ